MKTKKEICAIASCALAITLIVAFCVIRLLESPDVAESEMHENLESFPIYDNPELESEFGENNENRDCSGDDEPVVAAPIFDEQNPHLIDMDSLFEGVYALPPQPNGNNSTSDGEHGSVAGMAVRPVTAQVDFDGGVFETGITVGELLSRLDNDWSIDPEQERLVGDSLRPGQEFPAVRLLSGYWSGYAVSADISANNGNITVSVRNSTDENVSLGSAEIWRYSIDFSGISHQPGATPVTLLDMFTTRPEIDYNGLTWGMLHSEARKIINFSEAERDFRTRSPHVRTDSSIRYTFATRDGCRITLAFDARQRFSGITVESVTV